MTPPATYLWNPPPVHSLPVRGEAERLPINRLFFVGRNYHAHAVEMGRPVDKAIEQPFYFTKAPSTLVESGATVAYPPETKNYHHEMELVVAIGKPGFRVQPSDAAALIDGYACGLDMTRRDLQLEARDKGRPWEFGKSFALSAPVGSVHRVAEVGHPVAAAITLLVNGKPRQSSDIAKLIWSVAECIAVLSEYETLEPGDLIMTGTPEGVNAVVAGDVMQGAIAGLGEIEVRVTG